MALVISNTMKSNRLHIWFFTTLLLYQFADVAAKHTAKHRFPQEYEHNWFYYQPTLSPYIPGASRPLPDKWYESPDYRIEEPVFVPYFHAWGNEENRPYRVSPHLKQTQRLIASSKDENLGNIGCICTTVYKRLTLLAGCAILTTRHILTTASSTWLVLRDRFNYPTLEDILGIWYDNNHNTFNSSMYATPARIHFHKMFNLPELVNRSHPLPFTFDLAVWATTYNLYGWYRFGPSARCCLRATSSPHSHRSAVPTNEMFIISGFQWIWAYKKKPAPWYKYIYRTYYVTSPCPKIEWGWFICLPAKFMKYGIDSGAGLHRAFKGKSWRHDGLVGLGAFSMHLRSRDLTHYFTVLDNHVVLDFLYDTYLNRQKAVWLDARFHDTKGKAPRPKYHIPNNYPRGKQNYYFYYRLPI